MTKYFFAAPFGNYLKFTNAISVTGSWTVEPRPGLLWQIIKTLRYVPNASGGFGWRNKLGLRNAGIHKGLERRGSFLYLMEMRVDLYTQTQQISQQIINQNQHSLTTS